MEDLKELQRRVERLERTVGIYRWAGLGLCVLVAGLTTLGATTNPGSVADVLGHAGGEVYQPLAAAPEIEDESERSTRPVAAKSAPAQVEDVIQTRRLQIINSAGDVALDIGTSVSDKGRFEIKDEQGNQLVYLGPSSKGNAMLIMGGEGEASGLIYINGEDGNRLVSITPAASGHGSVFVNNKDGDGLVSMGSTVETGNGILVIRNRDGKQLITAAGGSSDGGLWMGNTDEDNLIYLGGSTDGDGMLNVKRKGGSRLVFVGADVDGAGMVGINNLDGSELITVGANTSGNGLIRVVNRNSELGAAIIASDSYGLMTLVASDGSDLVYLGADTEGHGVAETYSTSQDLIWSSNFVQQFAPPSGSSSGLLGDLDNDGDVDGTDFMLMAENYGKSSSAAKGTTKAGESGNKASP